MAEINASRLDIKSMRGDDEKNDKKDDNSV